VGKINDKATTQPNSTQKSSDKAVNFKREISLSLFTLSQNLSRVRLSCRLIAMIIELNVSKKKIINATFNALSGKSISLSNESPLTTAFAPLKSKERDIAEIVAENTTTRNVLNATNPSLLALALLSIT
jgi:hypothetical protein